MKASGSDLHTVPMHEVPAEATRPHTLDTRCRHRRPTLNHVCSTTALHRGAPDAVGVAEGDQAHALDEAEAGVGALQHAHGAAPASNTRS